MTHLLDRLKSKYEPPAPELASPIAFAETHSRGAYQRARHLELVEQVCLDAITHGKRVIISISVRHGKSWTVSQWLPAWYLGRHPDRRVILAGHEADFAARWGRAARDILTEHGPTVFGVNVSRRSEAANRWDIDGHQGGMLTVGVGGSPIGRGADLMIVDDPIKSYADAMSPLVRKRVQDWWTGTMVSRIEPGGAAILVMARWHDDDLAGFLLREDPDNWTEVRLPAIADTPDDPLGRAVGEPLWPERFPLEELERRRHETSLSLGQAVWLAQYQQTPRKASGDVFDSGRWRYGTLADIPPGTRWCRGWDLASTEGDGDYTASVRVGRAPDGRTFIDDAWQGQVSSDAMRRQLVATAQRDTTSTLVEVPQDPGQAGKDQAQQLTRLLAGYQVRAIPQTGDKALRASGLAAQQQAGNVTLIGGEYGERWQGEFIAECEEFPKGLHDDQVDAAAVAFNRLVAAPSQGQGRVRDQRLRGRR